MASLSVEGLQNLLKTIGEHHEIPDFPAADVRNDLMDVFVSYLAEYLVQATGCQPQTAYDCLQWPNETSDLVAVIPRLRLQDTDPVQVAAELSVAVSLSRSRNDQAISASDQCSSD